MRVRPRRVVGALALAAAVLGLWRCVPLAAVEIDEAGVPTKRQAHLPRDVDVLGEEELCGSGGCWRELTLGWSGHSADELARRLGVGGDAERCRAVSWLDRRTACVGVSSTGAPAPAAAPGSLTVEVRWDRPLGQ